MALTIDKKVKSLFNEIDEAVRHNEESSYILKLSQKSSTMSYESLTNLMMKIYKDKKREGLNDYKVMLDTLTNLTRYVFIMENAGKK